MRRLKMLSTFLALLGILALAGCGGLNSRPYSQPTSAPPLGTNCAIAQTITLGVTTFDDNGGCVQVSKGEPVTIDDSASSGGTHILCTGPSNGAYSAICVPNANAPALLKGNGFTIEPGMKKQITFTTPGIYNVICTIHPYMLIVVKVP